MVMLRNTRVQLQSEGTADPNDIVDFAEEAIAMISQNLRRPGGRIQRPDPNAAPGATTPTPTFMLGAKSQVRLTAARNLIRHYETVGRRLSVANTRWSPVTRIFKDRWKPLKEPQEG